MDTAKAFLTSARGKASFPGASVTTHTGGGGTIQLAGRKVVVAATPVGINTRDARAMAESSETKQARQELRSVLRVPQSVRLVASVDRLDYTKGFPQRLAAIKQFFIEHPESIGKVTFAQIAPRTREAQATFAEHDATVTALHDELQKFFSTDPTIQAFKVKNNAPSTWVPTVLHREAFTPNQVAALYQEADVAWVTSVADGKHLGPDEALMARGAARPGALVISNQVGAAELHRDHALLFHPNDTKAAVKSIHDALTMAPHEKKVRWVSAYNTAVSNDSGSWGRKNLELLIDKPN